MPDGQNPSAVAGIPVDDLAPIVGDAGAIVPPPAPPLPKPNQANANNNAPAQIDWSKVDPTTIPENVIKGSKAFQDVLSESIQRRQEIKALKEAGAKPADPAPTPNQQPANNQEKPPVWAEQILSRLDGVEKLAKEGGRKTLVDEALKTHNLPADAARYITGITSDEIAAQAADLSKTFLTPNANGSSAGGGTPETQVDRYKRAIANAVNGGKNPLSPVEGSLFNPAIQDRITGNR